MKSKRGLWRALESLSGGAVIAEWALELGDEFERSRHFLRPSGTTARDYPCTNRFRCQCRHRIEPSRQGGWMAVCDCGGCPPIRLNDPDVVEFKIDARQLLSAVTILCGWEARFGSTVVQRVWQMATVGDQQRPVLWWAGASEGQLREAADALVTAGLAPFVLITPTRNHWSPRLDACLRREGCLVVAMAEVVEFGDGAGFSLLVVAETVVRELEARATTHNCAEMLRTLHQKIDAVRDEHHELRRAKAKLEKMRGEGLFAFVNKVDDESFKILCAILAHGDVAKASRAIGMKDPTMRSRMEDWRTRGPAFKVLIEFVRWRKKIGRHEKVDLPESLFKARAPDVDYVGVLSDVLDELVSFDPENCEAKCEELAELIRPYVPR